MALGNDLHAAANGETSRFRAQPVGTAGSDHDTYSNADDDRQLPHRKERAIMGETKDDFDHQHTNRPVKPKLLRSKTEYLPRSAEDTEATDEEVPEWGARHGFEDHYQSEHIISQLANVSYFCY